VIVIGEMRDGETLDTAIKAVEMGHLVISALPTPDVTSTISRLHSMFPADAREIGRMRLAEATRSIISQRLLPRKDEKGRVAVVEVLLGAPATRACIQDPERLDGLKEKLAKTREPHGMQTFEQHLEELLQGGEITAETVIAAGGDEPAARKSGRKP
jgi:twitching motility protein PilT